MSQAKESTGHSSDDTALKAFQDPVNYLSHVFTSEREEGFHGYEDDPELALAYGLFYFPQTFCRTQFPIAEAMTYRGWKPTETRPLRILDLGCGMGAASMGAMDYLSRAARPKRFAVTGVDQSGGFLSVMRDLGNVIKEEAPEEMPSAAWTLLNRNVRKLHNSENRLLDEYDLIIVSFALGEFFYGTDTPEIAAWIDGLLERLSDDGLLIITEPSLKETAVRLELLRDFYSAKIRKPGEEGVPAYIWGPCLHCDECPMISMGGKFWCHEVRRWPVPESVEFMNRHLFRDILHLKFSHLVLGKTPPPKLDGHHTRLVSPVAKTSGKYLFSGCASDGSRHDYDLLFRHVKGDAKKEVQALHRGDLIRLAELEEKSQGDLMRIPSLDAIEGKFHA